MVAAIARVLISLCRLQRRGTLITQHSLYNTQHVRLHSSLVISDLTCSLHIHAVCLHVPQNILFPNGNHVEKRKNIVYSIFLLSQTSPFVSAVEARLRDLLDNYMNADSALVIDGKVRTCVL